MADRRSRNVNASFARAFQVSLSESDGQPFLSVCGGAWDVPELHTLLERALFGRKSFEGFEVEREFPSIGLRTVILSGRRLGQLDMVLLTIEDVTAHRETKKSLRISEERRRQAEKMEAVGRLAGGIAHDFNNLLTVIIGHCGLLADALEGNQEATNHVDEVRRSAERAAALTDQRLAFGRRKGPLPKVFDLNAVIVELRR